jgi:hypothetical protein
MAEVEERILVIEDAAIEPVARKEAACDAQEGPASLPVAGYPRVSTANALTGSDSRSQKSRT